MSATKRLPVQAFNYRLNPTVANRIWMERLMQKQALQKGRAAFDCASPIVGDDRKLRALTSAIGDVGKRIDENERVILRGSHKTVKADNLRQDLVRVAALAFGWLESIEEELK